jgi:PTH1 family peptidyl-tRNA hydrolase
MIAGEQVVALKPHTYMNDSGRSVGLAMRFFKLVPDSIVVFHDELDLAPARLRVKCGGGNGGHNGLRSLDAHLGADYWRVRMGIGHPGHKDLVSGYVLHDFAKAEMAWVTTMIDAFCESVELLVTGDANRFQTKVTLALNPPKPKPPRGDDGKTPKQDKSKESN